MKNNRYLIPIFLSLMLTLSMAVSTVYRAPYITPLLERLELIIYDVRLSSMLQSYEPALPVVIVDISEESLASIGQWPWPRDVIAKIVDRCFELGAAVVAFDVVFAEAERNSATVVIDKLSKSQLDDPQTRDRLLERIDLFDNNRVLAEALSHGEVVLGYAFNNDESNHNGVLSSPIETDLSVERMSALMSPRGYLANIELLQAASSGGGFFSLGLTPDSDGIIRRAPLVSVFNNQIYPSLALESVRRFMLDEYQINSSEIGESMSVDSIEIGGIRIPADSKGRMIIPSLTAMESEVRAVSPR